MATIRRKGDPSKYRVLDRACLGRECLALSHYESRGATLGGSRNTGVNPPAASGVRTTAAPAPFPSPPRKSSPSGRRKG